MLVQNEQNIETNFANENYMPTTTWAIQKTVLVRYCIQMSKNVIICR